MFQSIMDFKSRYTLTIKYISTSKETLKLLLNIRIILSSNKIFNYYKNNNLYITLLKFKNLRKNFIFNILRPLSINIENRHMSQASQIFHFLGASN